MVAVHLLRGSRGPLRVVLIERAGPPGRGIAYRGQPDSHVLNVRAGAMSAFTDEPDHFFVWLNDSASVNQKVGRDEFVPRRLYGEYLQQTLNDARAAASPLIEFEIVCDEVIGLQLEDREARLQLSSRATLQADWVVLALGNPGPADPPMADRKLLGDSRYFGNAWSESALQSLRPADDLLLIGSGLTTLDWLASLHERRHRGRIHVLSRRGLLPYENRVVPRHQLSFDPTALPPRLAPLMRELRTEALLMQQNNGDWRGMIDSLRPHIQMLWQRLPPPEKRRFLRHLRPHWEVHRHRAAPGVIEAVNGLRENGQLEVRAGRLLRLDPQPDGISVFASLRDGRKEWRLRVDRVINCTGPECDYRRLNQPLVEQLLQQNLICPDPLGLGLMTDDGGALCDEMGRPSDRLFTLGPPRKGQIWETTAVAEIRQQASLLALRLLGQLSLMPSIR